MTRQPLAIRRRTVHERRPHAVSGRRASLDAAAI